MNLGKEMVFSIAASRVNNNNNGNLLSAYPAAQSTEQAYTHNVHQDGKCPKINKKCIYRQVFKHNYAKDAHTHTHTHTHTHVRAQSR